MKPKFFATPEDFRKWLEKNHQSESELLVGFYRKGSGRPSITWPESVDQALCYGWIDGVRRSLDDESYTIRFTPRKPGSNWSRINIAKVKALTEAKLMQPAGVRAYEKRTEAKSVIYAYENKPKELAPEYEKKFRANKRAWKFWSEQPPGYKRQMMFYVMSAKREETRDRRLDTLIEESENERRVTLETRVKKT